MNFFKTSRGLTIINELDLSSSCMGSNSFNVSNLTPFNACVNNFWMDSLEPRKDDECMSESIPHDQGFKPPRRVTRSMTHNQVHGHLYQNQGLMPLKEYLTNA